MTIQAGTSIKQQQLVDEGNDLRNYIYNLIVWCSENVPAGEKSQVPADMLGTKNLRTFALSDFTSDTISISKVLNALQTIIATYTSVRKLQYREIRTGQWTDIVYDQTNITAMSSAYRQDLEANPSSYNLVKGAVVSASNMNNFMDWLKARYNILKENIVSYDYSFCHNYSQHINHSNRGRR